MGRIMPICFLKKEHEMRMIERMRVRRKIKKIYKMMNKRMSVSDMKESVDMIVQVLRILPSEKKEGLLNVCMEILKNEY